MTYSFEDEFEEREKDLDLLRHLVENLDNAKIEFADGTNYEFPARLVHILNAVVSIMSYNQAESSLRGCLEGLYDDFKDKSIEYQELKAPIQIQILKGILGKARHGAKNLHAEVGSSLNLKFPQASFCPRKISAGNVKKVTFVDVTKIYSIDILEDGSSLDQIQKHRKDLAHGFQSFSGLGADAPSIDFVNRSERTSKYLKAVISKFASYINNQHYLEE